MSEILPEGTDHVIPGATDMTSGTARDKIKAGAADLKSSASDKAAAFKSQASDRAMAFADDGKARAASALDSVAQLIGDGATQIDEKLGASYGDYVRKAAGVVSGVSDTLREKDVEQLLEEGRELVRRSPAIALGAAAAAGFVLSRLVKAGSDTLDQTARAIDPKPAATPAAAGANGAAPADIAAEPGAPA